MLVVEDGHINTLILKFTWKFKWPKRAKTSLKKNEIEDEFEEQTHISDT